VLASPFGLQVQKRCEAWIKRRNSEKRQQHTYIPQLEWEAHIVEYVSHVWRLVKAHRNSKKDSVPSLDLGIPLLGPRFLPPAYLHIQKRQENAVIEPKTAYLRPLNIVHPLYYHSIRKCPSCDSSEILWDSWNTAGHRDLHGVHEEEMALGYQLVCKCCKEAHMRTRNGINDSEGGGYSFSTTNQVFWTKMEHWQMPRECFVTM
jgi:hypothetical protein